MHLLDMNHAWQNAGHDSIVALVRRLTADADASLSEAGVRVRLISYDVRRNHIVPPAPSGVALYVGTGGPGHLDPRMNLRDDVEAGEILESGEWEAPLFELYGAIERDERAMLYGVCHTFGLLCRWSGIAEPALRSEEKGGPSIGIVENVLSPQALEHPWFARLAAHLPDGRHFPIVDSRHYDLIARRSTFPRGITPIAYETVPPRGAAQPALTMVEFARKADGVPRIFASNHHPEIPDAIELAALLEGKLAGGEVTRDWYESRAALVDQLLRRNHSEPARLLAAGYSFGFLLRDGLRDAIEAARRGSSVSKAL
ncbi:MAG: hypothetical protein WB615_14330 [Candidatus Tumulicola sp.]